MAATATATATTDSAVDKIEASKWRAAISKISPTDIKALPSMPCARNSLLYGIATAAGVGGISIAAGRGVRPGLNWAVGSFVFVSLASWETCRRARRAEQERMRTVIEGYRGRRAGSGSPQPSLGAETSGSGANTA